MSNDRPDRDEVIAAIQAVMTEKRFYGFPVSAVADAVLALFAVPGGVAVPDEAVERAAEALYEHTRDHDYTGAEWDWENIDNAYDREDLDEPDPHPEWLRNRYRSDVRVVLAAALGVAVPDEQRCEGRHSHCPRPTCFIHQRCMAGPAVSLEEGKL